MTTNPNPPTRLAAGADIPTPLDVLCGHLISANVTGVLPQDTVSLIPLGAPLLAIATREDWAAIFDLADPEGDRGGCWCQGPRPDPNTPSAGPPRGQARLIATDPIWPDPPTLAGVITDPDAEAE